MQPVARYLEGPAYIVYGPGPGVTAGSTKSGTQDGNDCHHHHHHHKDHEAQAHFWAVFHPNVDQKIRVEVHADKSVKEGSSRDLFILRGIPHPWGSYPPELSEPHGCRPPHLYYHVLLSQHVHHGQSEYPDTLQDIDQLSRMAENVETPTNDDDDNDNLREWALPFVHRLGDGKDDAGGLTSAYSLLEEQETADDFGDFIQEMLHQLSFNDLSSSSSTTTTTTTIATGNEELLLSHLYASTEILVSETRTMNTIEDHFFPSKTKGEEGLPKVLHDLQSHMTRVKSGLLPSEPLPFSLVKADLKLLLNTAKNQAYQSE